MSSPGGIPGKEKKHISKYFLKISRLSDLSLYVYYIYFFSLTKAVAPNPVDPFYKTKL